MSPMTNSLALWRARRPGNERRGKEKREEERRRRGRRERRREERASQTPKAPVRQRGRGAHIGEEEPNRSSWSHGGPYAFILSSFVFLLLSWTGPSGPSGQQQGLMCPTVRPGFTGSHVPSRPHQRAKEKILGEEPHHAWHACLCASPSGLCPGKTWPGRGWPKC